MSAALEARISLARPGGFRMELELTVAPGHTLALLGPNGAGKSSALAALAGLLPLEQGRISLGTRVLDEPTTDTWVPPEDRRIGVVFQDPLLFPAMNVLENVAFGLRSRRVPRGEAHALAEEWLGKLGLSHLADRRPRALSGGEAQRVALARALASQPDLLLLDEPLSSVDVRARAEMRDLLARHLQDFSGPRLLITHDPAEAFGLADAICILEDGRVTQRGAAQDIRMRPATPYAAQVGGANLFTGDTVRGEVTVGAHRLVIADTELAGPVRVSIRPSAMSVHLRRPEGSARNVWRTVVDRLHDDGSRVRLLTGPPLPVMVDLTHRSLEEMALARGVEIWLSLKATEIGVERV